MYDENGVATGWLSKGILTEGEKGWWDITELPIGLWTNTFKEYLEYLETGDPPKGSKKKKGEKYLKEIEWIENMNTVHVRIKPTKDFIPDIDVKNNFKILQTSHSLKNIVVFDENNYPRRYASPEELLKDFCVVSLKYYTKRKAYWLAEYEQEKWALEQRRIFVKAVVAANSKKKTPGEKELICIKRMMYSMRRWLNLDWKRRMTSLTIF